MLAVGNDDQWRRFCGAAELPALAGDARFATNPQRVAHREALVPLIAPVLRTRDRGDWTARLRAAGVPCGAVRTIGEALADPQLAARDMITTVAHPAAGPVRLVANPVHLSGASPGVDRPAPALGQHTDAVRDFRERGVI